MSSGRGAVGMARVVTMDLYRQLGGFEATWRWVAQVAGVPESRIQSVMIRTVTPALSCEIVLWLRPRPAEALKIMEEEGIFNDCPHPEVVGGRCTSCGDGSFPSDDDPFARLTPAGEPE